MSSDPTLFARPNAEAPLSMEAGIHLLNVDQDERDGLFFIPHGEGPFPLLVLFHGAGGQASQMLVPFRDLAEAQKVVLLVPDSRHRTWDIIEDEEFGPDVEFLDKALEFLFSKVRIDGSRIAVGGFSDGASYALSMGIANGDFFTHILSFSPGFMAPPFRKDSPPIFMTHGTKDQVLNINHCSRKLVPILKENKLTVTFKEFEGGHTLPPPLLKEAFTWFTGKQLLNNVRAPVDDKGLQST